MIIKKTVFENTKVLTKHFVIFDEIFRALNKLKYAELVHFLTHKTYGDHEWQFLDLHQKTFYFIIKTEIFIN